MVLSVAIRTMLFSQRFWNSFRAKQVIYVLPCFLEGTRFPLQCDYFSECLSLLLICNCKACLAGVMVDLGAHCFPPATILDEGGATWELVSPFLVILGPSSFV